MLECWLKKGCDFYSPNSKKNPYNPFICGDKDVCCIYIAAEIFQGPVTAGVMKKKAFPSIVDFLSLLFLISCIEAYSHGDRVSSLCQTHHGGVSWTPFFSLCGIWSLVFLLFSSICL